MGEECDREMTLAPEVKSFQVRCITVEAQLKSTLTEIHAWGKCGVQVHDKVVCLQKLAAPDFYVH